MSATRAKRFFVFDCESIGIHGEVFAVGGGIYNLQGKAESEFLYACHQNSVKGGPNGAEDPDSRRWVQLNTPDLPITHPHEKALRRQFWQEWMHAKTYQCAAVTETPWPVEAGFLSRCIADDPERYWTGPYPLFDVSSILALAGFNPLFEYPRTDDEMPKHNPLCDVRLTVRLLVDSISCVEDRKHCLSPFFAVL